MALRRTKWVSLLLALMLLPFSALAQTAQTAEAPHTIKSRTFPYYRSLDDEEETVESEMTLYFADGEDELPYVELTEYMRFFRDLMKDYDGWELEYDFEALEDNAFSVVRRDNHSQMIVSPKSDVFFFSDYNRFTQKPGVSTLVSILDLPDPDEMDPVALWSTAMTMVQEGDEEGLTNMLGLFAGQEENAQPSFFAAAGQSFNRPGNTLWLDTGAYGIDLIGQDGKCYVPMQTMNDLFLNNCYFLMIFNGEAVYGAAYGESTLLDTIRASEPRPMSLPLMMYNYSELLFLLDTFYGLKPEHGIDSFREMIAANDDLLDGFMSENAGEFDNSLSILLMRYLDDQHSGFTGGSWRAGLEDEMAELTDVMRALSAMGHSTSVSVSDEMRFEAARSRFYPDGVPAYEEVGDTAFVTFDEFSMTRSEPNDYYSYDPEDPAGPQDTIELMIYAHRQVTRPDSPVRHVVLDLSLNGGGESTAAVAVVCWFLNSASFALRDTMTGAMSIMEYTADLNQDGVMMGEQPDSLADGDYQLYCLISSHSFSCGNLVPAAFRDSHNVTLIGQRSGGGSCVVLPATSASGAQFQISGSKQLAIVKNGSFYNIDDGIEPDIVLTRRESFYDRPALVELIHAAK